ncbi:MAG: putative rane protein [Solirubrobacteraceae bacterium]|jgi:putative membrane protein|nr:putative rane protein [Solirubrobacteraceae bacterium]
MAHRVLGAQALCAFAVAAGVAGSAAPSIAQPARPQRPRTLECGAAKRTSAWDEQWLMSGIEGDRFEIQGGRLAQTKGATPAAQALGARLVQDHTASLRDARRAAVRFGLTVPKSPSPSQQWELRTVGALSGAEFDRSYADLEVQDHIQDIQESKAEVSKGCNTTVRGLARSDLPVLRRHLALARRVKASGA